MNFFNLATMRRLFAPRHELSCSWLLWLRLRDKLRERGRRCSRESGAFLLGRREDDRARVVDFVLYDDLDPHCLDSGIVRFNGRYFSELWAICKARSLSVVADIHVHPGGAETKRLRPRPPHDLPRRAHRLDPAALRDRASAAPGHRHVPIPRRQALGDGPGGRAQPLFPRRTLRRRRSCPR